MGTERILARRLKKMIEEWKLRQEGSFYVIAKL